MKEKIVDISLALLAYKINKELILRYSLLGGAIALFTAPIPGTSLLLIALEIVMIAHLVRNFGNNFRIDLLQMVLAIIIAPVVLGLKAFAGILGFIPVIGWLFKGFIAASVVAVIGTGTNYILKPTVSAIEAYNKSQSSSL